MSRSLWFVELLKKAFPHRFLLARATTLPLAGPLLHRWLFAGDRLYLLPSVRAIQRAPRRVIALDRPVPESTELVLPTRVIERLIDTARVHWIMHGCICRQAAGCTRHPVDLGCLYLGEAALGINPALGRRVTREEARAHVRRAGEAGLVHLVGRNKLDSQWLGVTPASRLLTICACCSCCCLWRMLPRLSPAIGAKVQALPGVAVRATEGCQGCGTCQDDVCFVDAIHLVDGRAAIGAACRGCGRCVEVCPHGAIEIALGPSSALDEVLEELTARVDLG